MGAVFEIIAREFLEYRDPALPILPSEAGSWWGGNPKTKKECEIDIVIRSVADDSVIIGVLLNILCSTAMINTGCSPYGSTITPALTYVSFRKQAHAIRSSLICFVS